jgi:hypothetical protein
LSRYFMGVFMGNFFRSFKEPLYGPLKYRTGRP